MNTALKLSMHESDSIEEIIQMFTKTFSDSEGEAEGLLIGKLVSDLLMTTDKANIRVFIATEAEKIIGCIIFTRLTFANGANAFLLSPVAVLTSCHGRGIGQELIKFGLDSLRQEGVELAFTYGDPGFYSKVGFKPVAEELIKAPLKLTHPDGWLGQSLIGEEIEPIAGESFCVKALDKAVYW
ncbi:putative acetyltransferase [Desulfomicrobium macestii]|uniref:Acetyltransferase n=1 Tax=Desulfomicrobium macestii TaxID=90731 RepID=A0ABR9H158_9BACT|nr:N-acetyltransferase [Desulfomicrobium macestii]MBE1424436.1 putative acetyltransferase [Desulfomicrobium macestii]